MLSALFTPQISDLEAQIAELQSQILLKQQRITALGEVESLTDGALATLTTAVEKITILSPKAITSLKAAVLDLFQSDEGNGGDSDGNQPIDPTPNLNGQHCEIDLDKHWRQAEPDGSAWELATPIACLLSDNPAQQFPYAELVQVSDAIAYMRRYDGEILAVYAGFTNKVKARLWGEHLAVHNTFASGFEIRSPKRLNGFKHELKFWRGMSLEAIQRLAECDLSKSPIASYGNASKRQPLSSNVAQPTRLEDIAIGDIVRSKTMKDWEYRVIGVTDAGHLDCERLGVTPALRLAMYPSSVELVSTVAEQDALDSIQQPAPTYKLYARGWKANNDNWQIHQAMKRQQQQTALLDATEPDF